MIAFLLTSIEFGLQNLCLKKQNKNIFYCPPLNFFLLLHSLGTTFEFNWLGEEASFKKLSYI